MTPARRRMVAGSVGLAAALAGGGFAWWRSHLAAGDGASAVPDDFWNLEFEPPVPGNALRLAALRGRPLIVNFWATWCPPCVEEMPALDRFYRQNASNGYQMIGLAVDQPSSVRSFLARTPVSYPIGMAGLVGTDLSRRLGNLSGGLPFTVVFSSTGAIAQRRLGQVRPEDLIAWISIK